MQEFRGGCHCGTIEVRYRSGTAPEDTSPRACQCDFCRKHNTRAVSDPAGSLDISVKAKADLGRYRFGLNTSDFLICRNCGVYVAAFMPDPDDAHGFATLMVDALAERARYPAAQPASYEAEDEAGRRQRRRQTWTPARLLVRP